MPPADNGPDPQENQVSGTCQLHDAEKKHGLGHHHTHAKGHGDDLDQLARGISQDGKDAAAPPQREGTSNDEQHAGARDGDQDYGRQGECHQVGHWNHG